MAKVFSGKELKTPRGSLRSLRVSPPVLTIVVVTLRFSNPSTSTLGAEDLMVKLGMAETAGAAETVTAEETMAARKARRDEENIVVKVVKEVEEMTPMTPWDCVGMGGTARADFLYQRTADVERSS